MIMEKLFQVSRIDFLLQAIKVLFTLILKAAP